MRDRRNYPTRQVFPNNVCRSGGAHHGLCVEGEGNENLFFFKYHNFFCLFYNKLIASNNKTLESIPRSFLLTTDCFGNFPFSALITLRFAARSTDVVSGRRRTIFIKLRLSKKGRTTVKRIFRFSFTSYLFHSFRKNIFMTCYCYQPLSS